MKADVILVRYGELSLKSTYVRKYFETTLIRNIKYAFTREDISQDITKERGRIYVTTDDVPKGLHVLQRIFGVVSCSPAAQTNANLSDISPVAVHIAKEKLTGAQSFAIRATRAGTHPFSSQEAAVHLGSAVVNSTHAPVNLTTPDVELFVEIRGKNAYVFTEKFKGLGGLPLNTQGRILAVIDNATSLLAAWFLMRRGCTLLIAHTKKTHEKMIKEFLSHWYAEADLISIDPAQPDFKTKLNDIAIKNDCDGIVIGLTLQDPTRALEQLTDWKTRCTVPVLTPLLAMDDDEIEQKKKERGILS
jgi:tRNA uracil 4-sulfurtransferase